jgi:hypothetical protein
MLSSNAHSSLFDGKAIEGEELLEMLYGSRVVFQ